METREFIICRGIPGSGKSFWAKSWVSGDPEKRVRICMDDIRLMLGGGPENYWVSSRERLVSQIKNHSIQVAMDLGYNIVIDNMNLNPNEIEALSRMVDGYNSSGIDEYKIIYKDFFDTPLETCIERDSKRPRPIGESVIRDIYNKYYDILKSSQMRPWDYYSTPSHPWVGSREIEEFRNSLPDDNKFTVSSWIWQKDEETLSDLVHLYYEFIEDLSKEFGKTRDEILELDPYGEIIGFPENWEPPGSKSYRKMYEFVKKELGKK